MLLLCAGRGLVCTQFHHVSVRGLSIPKETRTYKQGGSWRCPVVQLLKWMFGRAQQLCTAQGVFPQLLWNVGAPSTDLVWTGELGGMQTIWNRERRKQRADSWHFPGNLDGKFWVQSRKVLCSEAKRCVKAEVVHAVLSCFSLSFENV